MAYRFKLDEPVEKGFRRIGLEQIERARMLQADAQSRAIAVHETRKCMKRIRSLLRLVRPGLGEDVFRQENARFRDIAMQMSAARDGQVLLETLLKVEPEPCSVSLEFLAAIRQDLEYEIRTEEAAAASKPSGEGDVGRLLVEAAEAFSALSLDPAGLPVLMDGLRISYRRARHAFAEAYDAQTDEAFHELRKELQRHWRHMQLLGRAWPEMFEARVGAARTLSQMLGDDHDLSLLVHYLAGARVQHLSERERETLSRRATARQEQLRQEAGPRLEILLASPARPFAGMVGEVWRAARKLAEIGAGEH